MNAQSGRVVASAYVLIFIQPLGALLWLIPAAAVIGLPLYAWLLDARARAGQLPAIWWARRKLVMLLFAVAAFGFLSVTPDLVDSTILNGADGASRAIFPASVVAQALNNGLIWPGIARMAIFLLSYIGLVWILYRWGSGRANRASAKGRQAAPAAPKKQS